MIWRALQISDVPAACGLSRLAGWNQTEADWRGYLAFEPEGCFAVEIDGVLAGTATTLRYDASVGWVGMVLVHPDRRRLGLGTDLLRKAIAYLQARGTKSIKLDATPMGRKVYVPLGFQDEYEVSRVEAATPPLSDSAAAAAAAIPSDGERVRDAASRAGRQAAGAPLPPQASPSEDPRGAEPLQKNPGSAGDFAGTDGPRPEPQRLALLQPGMLAPIADLDEAAFGVRRPQVLSALSGRNPELCFVAGAAGAPPDGYLIARVGREAVQVGPWVARDAAVAAQLWAAFCRAAPGRRVFLDLPAGNPAGQALLASFGFRIQRSFTRMYLGDPGPPGTPAFIFGTGGAEKG